MLMDYVGYDKNFSLEGRVALITGAAKGIGKAIAVLFAEKGAGIILVDLLEDVEELASEISKLGREVLPLVADITKKDEVKRVTEEGIKKFGKIDILVNNAGVALTDDAENLSEDIWDKTMAINLKAPFLMSQSVGREMIKRGGGKIINLASQASIVALDRHLAYCSSKAGIVGLTKVLASEWAEFNINVNAISPTVTLTELGKRVWAGDVGEAMKKKIPVGRFAYPEEIAAVALYLASDAANMITGENLVIDGGYTII
jgi:NAD(P)-dependent dehydrogenase (short-subunit alcohol dehydrogenase family)